MKPVCILLTLLWIGCGKDATPPQVAASSSAPSPQTSAPPSAQPPATPVLGTSDNSGGTGRAEVIELKRISGDMLMLRMAFVNTGRETLSMTRDYADEKSSDINSVSGVNLIDPVNKKKYFIVRDSENTCVCSNGLKDVKPGDRITAWARFPAPPEDVQKLSVLIPHFPPIDDVVISK